MIGKRLPGERSNIALFITSFWTIIGLFILIVGHLSIVFFIYGIATNTDALAELELFIPILEQNHLYIVAGLALLLDIWIIISQKKRRDYKIKR
jgi:cadmium resistance protein CadD (predicted permease)